MEKWKLYLCGGVLVVSTLLNARTPAKTYASDNALFSRSSSTVAYFVTGMAKIYGVDPATAVWIASHESQLSWRGDVFNPALVGDDDKICPQGPNKGKKQRSRGLWQISDCYHPEVSDAVAFDIVSSTIWAMPQMKKNPNQWSTWKFRKQWFGY